MQKKITLADKNFGFEIKIDPKNQIRFWNDIMPYVWAWEDIHEKVHKGTAYYFMAKTYLSLGDIPSAYICFFNAIEEDKVVYPVLSKNFKEAPAYLTTSLVKDEGNDLYISVVVPLREYLQRFIDSYNLRSKRKFLIQKLDQGFLQNDALENIKRFFVANIHEIYHLSPINQSRMINNDYSKLKVIDTLFNIGLIVDQILEHRFLRGGKLRKDMANAVHQLALHLKWTTEQDVRTFIRSISVLPSPIGRGAC